MKLFLTETMPTITNISKTACLNYNLNLHFITNHINNCEYKLRPFHRINVRLRNPKATVAVYSNGKIVCLGSKRVNQGRLAIRKLARVIQKLGYNDLKISSVLVQNIAATHDCERNFDLRSLHKYIIQNRCGKSRFDLSKFPNLRINLKDWHYKTKIIISRRGKIIITGVKSEINIDEIYTSFTDFIEQYEHSVL